MDLPNQSNETCDVVHANNGGLVSKGLLLQPATSDGNLSEMLGNKMHLYSSCALVSRLMQTHSTSSSHCLLSEHQGMLKQFVKRGRGLGLSLEAIPVYSDKNMSNKILQSILVMNLSS